MADFIAIAVTDAYVLGYPFEDSESSGPWSIYDLATDEVRHSEGPRNLAWDGYAISESQFLVTESDGRGEPRLVVLDAGSMERTLILELERREHPQLLYFTRSERWAVLAPPEYLGDLVSDGRGLSVIDLETGEVAAEVVLGR